MANRKPIPQGTRTLVAAFAGLRCAMCRDGLWNQTSSGVLMPSGQVAHIRAVEPQGPRHDPHYADANHFDNLLYLCYPHHREIDDPKSADDYPVERLEQIKADHERWITETIERAMPDVSFSQLQVMLDALSQGRRGEPESYEIRPPKEKLDRNRIDERVRKIFMMGQMRFEEVSRFVEMADTELPGFVAKLRARFVEKYEQLRSEMDDPNAIYVAVVQWATAGPIDVLKQAAGYAIVSYFFITCDIFEK